ncbi:MAG: VOC family protein [Bacteroidales bacterium]|nr:VOC family protein [Bacteroidales bacterium]
MKTTLNPYLNFNGNCEEAMNFYKECLGGNLEFSTFDTAPMEVPEDYKKKILHSTLKFGDAVFMASDTMPGYEVQMGSSFAISINASSLDQAQSFFGKLSEGGNVMMPFEKAFWGGMFGMLQDKYGVNWMVSFQEEGSFVSE